LVIVGVFYGEGGVDNVLRNGVEADY